MGISVIVKYLLKKRQACVNNFFIKLVLQEENHQGNVEVDANLNFEAARKKLRKQSEPVRRCRKYRKPGRFWSNNSDEIHNRSNDNLQLPKKMNELSNNQPRGQYEFHKSMQSLSPIQKTQTYTNSFVTESLDQRVDRILANKKGVGYFPAPFHDLEADKNVDPNQMNPGLTSTPVSPNRKMFKSSEEKLYFSRLSAMTWPHQQASPSDSGYLSSHLDIPKENSETLNRSPTCWRDTTENATCLDSRLNQNHEFSTKSESYELSQGSGIKDVYQKPVDQTRGSQQSFSNPLRETKSCQNNNPKGTKTTIQKVAKTTIKKVAKTAIHSKQVNCLKTSQKYHLNIICSLNNVSDFPKMVWISRNQEIQ